MRWLIKVGGDQGTFNSTYQLPAKEFTRFNSTCVDILHSVAPLKKISDCTGYRLSIGLILRFFYLFLKLYKDWRPSTAELICPLSNPRLLRFSDQLLLAVPRTQLRSEGDCVFAVAAQNSLPFSMKCSPSVEAFKAKLKTHVFSEAFESSFVYAIG